MTTAAQKSGWTCPKCGRHFAKMNQAHVCERWTVEDLLDGKPESTRQLFEQFVALVKTCGAFEFSVTKSNVGFRGKRRIFLGVIPTDKGLKGHVDLPYLADDPFFRRAAAYTNRLWVHYFTITSPDQLDQKFAHWLDDAYAVGQGTDLK